MVDKSLSIAVYLYLSKSYNIEKSMAMFKELECGYEVLATAKGSTVSVAFGECKILGICRKMKVP